MNYDLLLMFAGYFISLGIGWSLFSKSKDGHNKNYKYFKWPLYALITFISVYTVLLIENLAFDFGVSWMFYVLGIQILFLLYFYAFTFKQTRCWKQHRMIIYHFLLLPIFFFSSLVYESRGTYWVIGFIYLYNILEFQFAKFDRKQKLIWD